MKAFKAILMTVMLGAAMSATAQVTNQLFDKGWTFTQNGQSISVDLPHDWDIYTSPAPKVGAYIYRNVKVHQGRDEESSTIRISTVDGKNI